MTVEARAEGSQTSVRPGSVVLGVLVDKLLVIPWVVALAAFLGTTSLAFEWLVLPVGFACTTIGAYVGAWHAGRLQVRHGVWVGLIGLLISLVRYFVTALWPPENPAVVHPLWWELIAWASVVCAGYVGGRLATPRAG